MNIRINHLDDLITADLRANRTLHFTLGSTTLIGSFLWLKILTLWLVYCIVPIAFRSVMVHKRFSNNNKPFESTFVSVYYVHVIRDVSVWSKRKTRIGFLKGSLFYTNSKYAQTTIFAQSRAHPDNPIVYLVHFPALLLFQNFCRLIH